VELLLNLAWALVSCLLATLWLVSTFRAQQSTGRSRLPLLPGRATQLTALLLLVVILLPVISLTDDLMMSATLAETEHVQRLDLLHDAFHPLPHALPGVLAALVLAPDAPRLFQHLQPRFEPASPAHSLGFYRPVENRPPPAA
jgi:hypothetical protein